MASNNDVLAGMQKIGTDAIQSQSNPHIGPRFTQNNFVRFCGIPVSSQIIAVGSDYAYELRSLVKHASTSVL